MSRSRRGLLMGLLAALCWSPHFSSVSGAVREGVSPLVVHFYLLLWAAAGCLLLLALGGRLGELSVFKRRESQLIIMALTGGYGLWLLRGLALQGGPQARAHVHLLFYAAPLMLGLFSLPARDGARGRQMGALVLGFVGCILIAYPSPGAESGAPALRFGTALAACGAAACWALFSLAARPLVREEKLLPVCAVLWSLGAVCLLATSLATGDSVLAISRGALRTTLWLGPLSVAVAFGCWLKGLAELAPGSAAPLWYVALAFGVALGTERLGPWSLGGAALIVLAVLFASGRREQPYMSMSDIIRG